MVTNTFQKEYRVYFMQIDAQFDLPTPISRRQEYKAVNDLGARLCRWEIYLHDVKLKPGQEAYLKIFTADGKLQGIKDLAENYWLPQKNGNFRKRIRR